MSAYLLKQACSIIGKLADFTLLMFITNKLIIIINIINAFLIVLKVNVLFIKIMEETSLSL